MQKYLLQMVGLLLAFATFSWLNFATANAATFTNTPIAVSNTYNGTITLQIGGLTNGETVVIQKFIDANTNGVIDGNDWLAQQFNLTDGQTGMVIGGVTNFNVPADLNSAASAITATLNFVNGDDLQNFVGKFLFKLSSPTGHFTPITNSFNVTNFPYAQKISGNIVSNGTNVPNAGVVVMSWPLRVGFAGTIADNSGSYTIALPPGAYTLVAFKSNYVANMMMSPVVNLGSSQTVTTNLPTTSATASISGKVVDADNSSIVLPGVMVVAESATGSVTVGFTDTNGNFTVRVQSGQWRVRPDDLSLIVHGYVGLQDGTNVSAGATGITIAVPRATALVYGGVRDNQGKSLPGIDIYAEENSNYQFQTDAYTGTNGNYYAAVLAGDWFLYVSEDSNPTNYIYSGGQEVTLTNGQAFELNFTALPAANHINGSLKDNNNNPLSGVGMWANSMINGIFFQSWVETDNSGNYSLNVANSNCWTVGIEACTNCDYGLPNNYLRPANQTVCITNNNAVVDFIVYPVWFPFVSQPVRISPTQLGFTLAGTAGTNYIIQASTNLSTTNWFTVLVTNLLFDSAFIQDNQATNKQRFYRAKAGL